MKYLGMNRDTGEALTGIDHIRQSVRDILLTPEAAAWHVVNTAPCFPRSLTSRRTASPVCRLWRRPIPH